MDCLEYTFILCRLLFCRGRTRNATTGICAYKVVSVLPAFGKGKFQPNTGQSEEHPDLPLTAKLGLFKYSVGTLGRTVDRSVVTLIMQGLCDAISKRGKVQIYHWGDYLCCSASLFTLAVVFLNTNEGSGTWSSGQSLHQTAAKCLLCNKCQHSAVLCETMTLWKKDNATLSEHVPLLFCISVCLSD